LHQLARLWAAVASDSEAGDCTSAALVLADALLEQGDWRGELLALAVSEGKKVRCTSNRDAEAQRMMSAAHPPNNLLREATGRWHKRRVHAIYCNSYEKPPRECSCPVRMRMPPGPPLYRAFRQLDSGGWTFENVYSAAEPEREGLRISFDEFEAWEAVMLAREACALADVPFNNDTLNHCRSQLRLDWRPMSAAFIAYRLAGYLGNHQLSGRLLEQAQREQKAQLEWLRGSYSVAVAEISAAT
jgi:hypothetical protein